MTASERIRTARDEREAREESIRARIAENVRLAEEHGDRKRAADWRAGLAQLEASWEK